MVHIARPKLIATASNGVLHPSTHESLCRLAALSHRTDKVSLRPAVAELEAGRVPAAKPGSPDPVFDETILARAIAGHILAGVWPELERWVVEHPPGLGSVSDGNLFSISRLNPEADPIDMLYIFSSRMVENFIDRWCARAQSDSGWDDRLVRTYREYAARNIATLIARDPSKVISEISNLGLQVILAFIEVVPKVFEQQFRRKITQAEFHQILSSGAIDRHVIVLSDGNALVVNMVEEQLAIPPSSLETEVPRFRFRSQPFVLVGEGNHLQLALTDTFLRKVEGEAARIRFTTSLHTGCPARAAEKVFRGFWDWSVALAEHFYVPRYAG